MLWWSKQTTLKIKIQTNSTILLQKVDQHLDKDCAGNNYWSSNISVIAFNSSRCSCLMHIHVVNNASLRAGNTWLIVTFRRHLSINHCTCGLTRKCQWHSKSIFDRDFIRLTFFFDESCQDFVNILTSGNISSGHSEIKFSSKSLSLIDWIMLLDMSLALYIVISAFLNLISHSWKTIYFWDSSILTRFANWPLELFFQSMKS